MVKVTSLLIRFSFGVRAQAENEDMVRYRHVHAISSLSETNLGVEG